MATPKKQTLKQVQADAQRLTARRLEDDEFVPHYPNGYNADVAQAPKVTKKEEGK